MDEKKVDKIKKEKGKKIKKIFGWILSVVVAGFIINVLANYFTKDKIRVEFRLEGTIVIGAAKAGVLEKLELKYDNEKIQNVQKITWSIANKEKGIGKLNGTMKIKYPESLNVLEVKLSETSERLRDLNSLKEKEKRIQAVLNKERKYIEIKKRRYF